MSLVFARSPLLRRWVDIRLGKARPYPTWSSASPRKEIRLYIDVTEFSRSDAGTGIQRVVREVLRNLSPPCGIEVVLVQARKQGDFVAITPPCSQIVDEPVQAEHGDIFLGLDLSLDGIWRSAEQLQKWRQAGVELWFVVYDLLPLEEPNWFSDKLAARFHRWFEVIRRLGSGYLCISEVVKQQLCSRLTGSYRYLPIEILPLGCDFTPRDDDEGVAALRGRSSVVVPDNPFVLMVGTIEPRKGHENILSAFEELWKSGSSTSLVIVGAAGWKTSVIQNRILSHSALGNKLFWFDNCSDRSLIELYRQCSGVIIASFSEGFGLPVVEALGHGKQVLARDIPVFKAHTGPSVTFFPQDSSPGQLATIIAAWHADATTPSTSHCGKLVSWSDTTETLFRILVKNYTDAP